MSDNLTFTATLELSGKSATGLVVPPEIVEQLGAGKRPKVVVCLNGYSYRSSIAPMSGDFMIPVSSDVRAAAKVNACDKVTVQVSVDTEERKVEVPLDFQELLDSNSKARSAFEWLSYSNKRRHVLSIEDAKTPETRQRRLHKAIRELSVE